MRLIAVIALLALLTPCIAVSDNVITGPYKVSFDLGLNKSDYNVTAQDPKETEELSGETGIDYSIDIANNTGLRFATITIKYFTDETPVITGSIWKQVLDDSDGKDPRLFNYHSAVRNIDGASGAISSGTTELYSGVFIDAYYAIYQPRFDPKHVVVGIFSTFPWEEGTLQLLKTIHVEKA